MNRRVVAGDDTRARGNIMEAFLQREDRMTAVRRKVIMIDQEYDGKREKVRMNGVDVNK